MVGDKSSSYITIQFLHSHYDDITSNKVHINLMCDVLLDTSEYCALLVSYISQRNYSRLKQYFIENY